MALPVIEAQTELFNRSQMPPSGHQPAQEETFECLEKLSKLQRSGIRMILLGMTPEKFMGKPSVQLILLWSTMILFHAVYACYELVLGFCFSRNLLEMITHVYIASYMLAFNFQWYYVVLSLLPELLNSPFRLEDFHCTKLHPDATKRITDECTSHLIRVMIGSAIWWLMNTAMHAIGSLAQALVMFIVHGHVEEIYVLPQIFLFPFWAQCLMYLSNSFSTMLITNYCLSCFTIIGVEVTKMKALCGILNEALMRDSEGNVRDFVEDHCNIIKRAKILNKQLEMFSLVMVTACYLDFGTQMFVMTLFKGSAAYYVAVIMDLLSMLLILCLQCFMSATITESLKTIANGSYFSQWFGKDRARARHVQLMIQMAQQSYEQKIWFKSVKIDRATALDLLRSSYAVYTALMIFQKE